MVIGEVTRELAPVLRLLASSSDEQRTYLQRLGTWPSLDELGLELDDILGTSLQERDPSTLDSAEKILHALDALLHDMSAASPDLWDGPALSNDERWAEVRRLAAAALAALPRPVAS